MFVLDPFPGSWNTWLCKHTVLLVLPRIFPKKGGVIGDSPRRGNCFAILGSLSWYNTGLEPRIVRKDFRVRHDRRGLGVRDYIHEILYRILKVTIHKGCRHRRDKYNQTVSYHVFHGFDFLVNVFHFNELDQEEQYSNKQRENEIHFITI